MDSTSDDLSPQAPTRTTGNGDQWTLQAAIEPWPDPLLDRRGHDPRSRYAENFWVPVIGPSASWILRRLADGFDTDPDGYTINLEQLAGSIGLSINRGNRSPFARAMHRCVMFGLARRTDVGWAIRRRLPTVAQRHLARLPDNLQHLHRHWDHTATDRPATTPRRSAPHTSSPADPNNPDQIPEHEPGTALTDRGQDRRRPPTSEPLLPPMGDQNDDQIQQPRQRLTGLTPMPAPDNDTFTIANREDTVTHVNDWLAADPRRAVPEIDFGTVWTDHRDPGEQWRVSYNPGSGELYAASRRDGTVEVLAHYPTAADAAQQLTGWERTADQPGGLGWLRDITRSPNQSTAAQILDTWTHPHNPTPQPPPHQLGH